MCLTTGVRERQFASYVLSVSGASAAMENSTQVVWAAPVCDV